MHIISMYGSIDGWTRLAWRCRMDPPGIPHVSGSLAKRCQTLEPFWSKKYNKKYKCTSWPKWSPQAMWAWKAAALLSTSLHNNWPFFPHEMQLLNALNSDAINWCFHLKQILQKFSKISADCKSHDGCCKASHHSRYVAGPESIILFRPHHHVTLNQQDPPMAHIIRIKWTYCRKTLQETWSNLLKFFSQLHQNLDEINLSDPRHHSPAWSFHWPRGFYLKNRCLETWKIHAAHTFPSKSQVDRKSLLPTKPWGKQHLKKKQHVQIQSNQINPYWYWWVGGFDDTHEPINPLQSIQSNQIKSNQTINPQHFFILFLKVLWKNTLHHSKENGCHVFFFEKKPCWVFFFSVPQLPTKRLTKAPSNSKAKAWAPWCVFLFAPEISDGWKMKLRENLSTSQLWWFFQDNFGFLKIWVEFTDTDDTHDTHLMDWCFWTNPFEKNMMRKSKWKFFPKVRDENRKCLSCHHLKWSLFRGRAVSFREWTL